MKKIKDTKGLPLFMKTNTFKISDVTKACILTRLGVSVSKSSCYFHGLFFDVWYSWIRLLHLEREKKTWKPTCSKLKTPYFQMSQHLSLPVWGVSPRSCWELHGLFWEASENLTGLLHLAREKSNKKTRISFSVVALGNNNWSRICLRRQIQIERKSHAGDYFRRLLHLEQ